MLIYIAKNRINNKIYIGQTTKTLEERISFYKRESQSNSEHMRPMGIAIKKYGLENFTFSILKDNIQTKDELDYYEKFYISKYDACNPDIGYNIELGGNSIEKHSDIVKQKISQAQIGELNHMYGKTAYKNATSKKVIDLTTGIKYGSACEAARQLHLQFSHICSVCRGERGSTGKRVFRFVEGDKIIIPKSNCSIKTKNILNKILPIYKQYI